MNAIELEAEIINESTDWSNEQVIQWINQYAENYRKLIELWIEDKETIKIRLYKTS